MLSDWLFRLRALLWRTSVDRDLDEELRAHVACQTEAYVRAGVPPDEARRRARLEFGGVEQIREECRDARGVGLVEDLVQDVRFGFRQLRRAPGFSAAAVATLALGIGATTAMFSLVYALMLRPLPFADPDRLVLLWNATTASSWDGPVSFPNYSDWKHEARSFEAMAAWSAYIGLRLNLTGTSRPQQLQYALVTHDLFATLGVHPALGQSFADTDDRPGGRRVVIISDGLWKRAFGANRGVVGSGIELDGAAYTVLGIMPAGFAFTRFPSDADLWLPVGLDPAMRIPGRGRMFARPVGYLGVVARLRKGVTVAQARAEMQTVARHLETAYRENTGKGVRLEPVEGTTTPGLRTALVALLGAVGLVLLIACANVANLTLARASGRRHEFALRVALGAGRVRLVRQIFTETTLVGVLGGAAGLILARWGIRLLALLPYNTPSFSSPYYTAADQICIDWRVAGFTLALSICTGLLFGFAPVRSATRLSAPAAFKRGSAGQAGQNRLRETLVVAELALSLVLLVGAGLLVKSLDRLQSVDPGFDSSNAIVMEISLPLAKYGDLNKATAFDDELLSRVEALPGVRAAGLSTVVPLSGGDEGSDFSVAGRPVPPPGHEDIAATRSVSAGYLRAMGIRMASGRPFDGADRPGAARVAIVNETLARRMWPGESAIGKRLALHVEALKFGPRPGPPTLDRESAWREVVGVVKDVRHGGLAAAPDAEVYVPCPQAPSRDMSLVVRTASDPDRIAAAVRAQVSLIDKDQPVSGVRSLAQLRADSLARPRFNALLSGLFSALATLLALVGAYGVISYSVGQRTQEIGVRMAIGARARDILRLTLAGGLRMAGLGIAVGLGGALVAARLLRTLLFAVEPFDATIFTAVPLLLLAITIVATALPARRAMRVDPVRALRHD